MPFEGMTSKQQLVAARKGLVSWHLLPRDLSPGCVDLLRGLLEPEARFRYDAVALACHPFLVPLDPQMLDRVRLLEDAVLADSDGELGGLAASHRHDSAGVGEMLDRLVLERWEVDNPFVASSSAGRGSGFGLSQLEAAIAAAPGREERFGYSLDEGTGRGREGAGVGKSSREGATGKSMRRDRQREDRAALEQAILDVYGRRLGVRPIW